MNATSMECGMGWLRDYPDPWDYTPEHEEISPARARMGVREPIKAMVGKLGLQEPERLSLPVAVDLRQWCPPIEDQGLLGSCTAHAGTGLVEYYERKALGQYVHASRLFLYKVTRELLGWTGDRGAHLRTTMGAMVLFGMPPETYWPYLDIEANFDVEPPAFCYAFAQNYKALQYFRLDPPETAKNVLLLRIKAYLAAKCPLMFGFTVFNSIDQATDEGRIPYPCPGEVVRGGHAVATVGYDDKAKIRNKICGVETTGALLVRNSWGATWGDGGYGWLPYEYVLRGIAVDWWTLLKNDWVETGQFGV
jgi:C1A family cysteine protease